jgi:hypothetical protein
MITASACGGLLLKLLLLLLPLTPVAILKADFLMMLPSGRLLKSVLREDGKNTAWRVGMGADPSSLGKLDMEIADIDQLQPHCLTPTEQA